MLPKINVLKTILLKGVTPFSTNSLWFAPGGKGKLVLSVRYRKWKNRLAELLPDGFLPSDMTGFGLYIEVGVFREFDVDNTLKSLIDALQKKYGFNDNQIDYLHAKKVIVRGFDPNSPGDRSKDYIKICLIEAIKLTESRDHVTWQPTRQELDGLQAHVQDDNYAFYSNGRNVQKETSLDGN